MNPYAWPKLLAHHYQQDRLANFYLLHTPRAFEEKDFFEPFRSALNIDPKKGISDVTTFNPQGRPFSKETFNRAEFEKKVSFHPLHLKKHFIVFFDAHHLGELYGNYLLKTLENPPSSVVFILVTHGPSSLLKTILSRAIVLRHWEQSKSLEEIKLETQNWDPQNFFEKMKPQHQHMKWQERISKAFTRPEELEGLKRWLSQKTLCPEDTYNPFETLESLQEFEQSFRFFNSPSTRWALLFGQAQK